MSYVRDTYITNYFYFFDGVVKLLGGEFEQFNRNI